MANDQPSDGHQHLNEAARTLYLKKNNNDCKMHTTFTINLSISNYWNWCKKVGKNTVAIR